MVVIFAILSLLFVPPRTLILSHQVHIVASSSTSLLTKRKFVILINQSVTFLRVDDSSSAFYIGRDDFI